MKKKTLYPPPFWSDRLFAVAVGFLFFWFFFFTITSVLVKLHAFAHHERACICL